MSDIATRFASIIDCVRSIYGPDFVPLHRPVFAGNERQYLLDCIDSNFVSSLGEKVTEFEQRIAAFTGVRHAVATVTTAKIPHPYEFVHDETGYNYRLPNLNAALGCAQMERLPEMLAAKAAVAARYATFFAEAGIPFVQAPPGTVSNCWLNAIVLESRTERDAFLEYSNGQGVMVRPIWRLMHRLAMYADRPHDGLANSIWLEERVVNIPSSVPDSALRSLTP